MVGHFWKAIVRPEETKCLFIPCPYIVVVSIVLFKP